MKLLKYIGVPRSLLSVHHVYLQISYQIIVSSSVSINKAFFVNLLMVSSLKRLCSYACSIIMTPNLKHSVDWPVNLFNLCRKFGQQSDVNFIFIMSNLKMLSNILYIILRFLFLIRVCDFILPELRSKVIFSRTPILVCWLIRHEVEIPDQKNISSATSSQQASGKNSEKVRSRL